MICEHHWLIEAPRGPRSLGRCKHCGAERTFSNILPYELDFARDAQARLERHRKRLTKMMASERSLGPTAIERGYRE